MKTVARTLIKGSAIEPICQKYRVKLSNKTTIEFSIGSTTFELSLPEGDWHTEHLQGLQEKGELYEPALSNTLLEQFSENTVFYDIGSGVGYFSRLAIASGLSGSNIHAFDPNAYRCSIINHNLSQHDVITVNQKVGVENSRDTISIDEYVRHHPTPDVMKIDVDGGEIDAVQGMAQTLQDSGPELYIEVHPQLLPNGSDSAKALCKRLESFGYSAKWIDHRNSGMEWEGKIPFLSRDEEEFLIKFSKPK